MKNLEFNNSSKVVYGPLRGNPPPVSNSFKTVKRSVQVQLPVPTSPNSAVMKTGDLSTALGNLAGDFQVLRVDAYSTSLPAGTLFPTATFVLNQKTLLQNSNGADLQDVSVSDFGTASSAPGVSFRLPKGRSTWLTKDTAGTATVLSCSTGCYVVVQVMQQIAA